MRTCALFLPRRGDAKSLRLDKKVDNLRQDQVGGEFGDSSDDDDDDSDGDILGDVRRRLGRFKKKKRPWRKEDAEKLVLVYGKWRGEWRAPVHLYSTVLLYPGGLYILTPAALHQGSLLKPAMS